MGTLLPGNDSFKVHKLFAISPVASINTRYLDRLKYTWNNRLHFRWQESSPSVWSVRFISHKTRIKAMTLNHTTTPTLQYQRRVKLCHYCITRPYFRKHGGRSFFGFGISRRGCLCLFHWEADRVRSNTYHPQHLRLCYRWVDFEYFFNNWWRKNKLYLLVLAQSCSITRWACT